MPATSKRLLVYIPREGCHIISAAIAAAAHYPTTRQIGHCLDPAGAKDEANLPAPWDWQQKPASRRALQHSHRDRPQ